MGYSPIGKPLMTARLYCLDDLLIDTGIRHCRKQVLSWLQQKQITKTCLTHYHEDHSGNAAAVREQFAIPVSGHPVTVEKMKAPKSIYPYQYLMWGASEAVEMAPLGPVIETEHFKLMPVHTPGHSRDHTAYWEPDQGWLFSGDLYLGDRIKYFRADEVFKDQMASLEKALRLDFDTLFCSHNPRLSDGKRYLARKLDFFRSLAEQVRHLRQKGLTARQIMKHAGIKEVLPIKLLCAGNVKAEYIVESAIEMIEEAPPVKLSSLPGNSDKAECRDAGSR